MIFEAVITTLNEDASPHIAPMGFHYEGPRVIIAPFRPCRTLSNLERRGEAVLNLTDNVAIIAGCLTGRRSWPTAPVASIQGCRLTDTLAHIEVRALRVEPDELRPRFVCEVVHEQAHRAFQGFNRAQGAVIEAAILVSRLSRLPVAKVDADIDYLRTAIDKTAGEREREAWAWLMERVQAFRRDRLGDVA